MAVRVSSGELPLIKPKHDCKFYHKKSLKDVYSIRVKYYACNFSRLQFASH